MSFPCTGCGACCLHVGDSPLTQWMDRGDGGCRHFDDVSAKCDIYEDRPQICRIDEYHAVLAPNFDRDTYYRANAMICNELQELHSLPKSKRINLAGT